MLNRASTHIIFSYHHIAAVTHPITCSRPLLRDPSDLWGTIRFRQARSCQTYSVAFLRGLLQAESPQWAQPERPKAQPLALPLDLNTDLSPYGRVLQGASERRWAQK